MKESDTFDSWELFSPKLGRARYDFKPDIEIFEDENHVYITMDAGYLNEEEINLVVRPDMVIVHIDAKRLKFHKELDLASKVNPDTLIKTFKNGVLDVSIEKDDKAMN